MSYYCFKCDQPRDKRANPPEIINDELVCDECMEDEDMSFHKEVWKTLSAINVNNNTETLNKGTYQLTYLSWSVGS